MRIYGDAFWDRKQMKQKVRRTRAKIILSVDPSIYVHVRDTVTAKHAWDKLRKAYEDSELSRKVGLLRTLVTT